MSCDSSSFPQNSSDTNFNDYDRLTEDDGSSDFSVRKLTHSVSFDGSTTSQSVQQQNQPQQEQQQAQSRAQQENVEKLQSQFTKKGNLFAQSKSFDQADLGVGKNKKNIINHFNSMTMYDSVVRSDDFKDSVAGSDKIFTSNLVIKPSSKSGLFEDVTCELKDCNVLPRPSYTSHHHDTQLYHYNECSEDRKGAAAAPTAGSSDGPYNKKMTSPSQYSWPLDNTVSLPLTSDSNRNRNSTIDVIMEGPSSNGESSDSLGSASAHRPTRNAKDDELGPHSHNSRSDEFNFTVDPNAISIAEGSSDPEASDERPEGNNNNGGNNKRVNFNARRDGSHGGTTSTVGDNNNDFVPRQPRKSRPRTRVKHFRPKGKSGPAKRAIASYAVSVGHLLLYLPAMFVVGLKGPTLAPGAALFCGIVVYCEFIVQPVALLLISPRLRVEVIKTIYYFIGRR